MPTPITLVYAGRRLDTKGKAIHEWRLDDDRLLYYAKLAGSAIGGTYSVDGSIDGATVSVNPHTLRYSGTKDADPDQIALWQAEDQHTRAVVAEAAAERRHAKSTELDDALAPLLAIVQRARTQAEARALIKVVSDKLTQAYWRR